MRACWKCLLLLFYLFIFFLSVSLFAYSLTNQQVWGQGSGLNTEATHRLKRIRVCASAFADIHEQSKYTACGHAIRFASDSRLICAFLRAAGRLTGLVDVAQQLGDFDEASHCALRLLLQPLVVLPEALHLGLQHPFVFFLLKDIDTQQKQKPSLRSLWQERETSDRYSGGFKETNGHIHTQRENRVWNKKRHIGWRICTSQYRAGKENNWSLIQLFPFTEDEGSSNSKWQ